LVDCGYGKHEAFLTKPVAEGNLTGGVFLVEIPISYPGEKSERDPNDLIKTGFRAGELTQLYRMCGMECESVLPVQWKGNISKAITQERLLDKLDEEERALLYRSKSVRAKKLNHNMVDACAMGLWRVRRWRGRPTNL